MKNVMIRIIGRHISAGSSGDDRIEFMTEGKAYLRSGSIFLVYEEGAASEMPYSRTTMKIDPAGKIRMKRFGKSSMSDSVMEFEKGKRHSSSYSTPYGPLEIEILTNKLVNEIDPDTLTGSLLIDYEMVLKGLAENRTLLNMEVFEAGGSKLN